MANTLGANNLVGTFVTTSDLLNTATQSNPVVKGSGLPASYTPAASITLSAAATTNTYSVGQPETFFVYAQTSSGTPTIALQFSPNPQGPWTVAASATLVANTLSTFVGQAPFVAYVAPTSTIGLPSAAAVAGSVSSPYWQLTISAGCTLTTLNVITAVALTKGEDFVDIAGGANAALNQPTGSSGTATVGYANGQLALNTLS